MGIPTLLDRIYAEMDRLDDIDMDDKEQVNSEVGRARAVAALANSAVDAMGITLKALEVSGMMDNAAAKAYCKGFLMGGGE